MTQSTEAGALSHLRVLEVGDKPASYAGHFLADLGADVVKIEPPGGAAERFEPPFAADVEGPDRGLSFIHFNANKRSVVMDLATEADRAAFLDLATTADILIEATPVSHLSDLGIGFEELQDRNPRLVMVSMTPFGQTGPLAQYKGNHAVTEAMSGVIFTLGDDTRAPSISPNELLSQVAGIHAANTALAAIFNNRHGGAGQRIDLSIQEIGTHMTTGLADYSLTRAIRRRPGKEAVGGVTAIYETTDGYAHIQPDFPHMWDALSQWLNDPMFEGEEWKDREYRNQNRDVLQMILQPFVAGMSTEEVTGEAQRRKIPTGPINSVSDMVTSDHVKTLGSFIDRNHPEVGDYQSTTFPFRMNETPMQNRRPAPRVGEHQQEVLGQRNAQTTASSSRGGSRSTRKKPLEGLRILDFTRVIAGPAGTQFLAYMGADIIKIESQNLAGAVRQPGPNFVDINRGKRSVVLDSRTAEARDIAMRLAETCDLVIDNFSAGVMDRLGLGYEAFKKVKSDIIAISMPGFGLTGPLRDWVAYGQILQAYTGLTYLWRAPETHVQACIKGPVADYVSAAELGLAVLSSVEYRARTGEGQFIELSMQEGLAHMLAPQSLEYTINKREPQPKGYQSTRYAPNGAYACLGDDQWCVISVETDEEWAAFQAAAGEPGWALEERFQTKAGRIENRAALDAAISTWTAEYTPRQVMHFLQKAGVPAGMVQSSEDLFYDYHLIRRGHIVEVNHPEPWGPFAHQGLPWQFSDTPADAAIPAPKLGEHTDEVLSQILGMDAREIAALKELKVLY